MRKARYIAPWHRPDFDPTAFPASEKTSTDASAQAASPLAGKPAIYHCVSRVVNREFVLGEEEKDHFVSLMRQYEKFCQVRVLTYCVMSNHFHILLEVPSRPQTPDTAFPRDEAFLEHLRILYTDGQVAEIGRKIAELRSAEKKGNPSERQARQRQIHEIMEPHLRRMWDLSAFMKTLKQRFTQWYNRTHARKGTLWEERFKSLLVEDGHAARVIAAYIDLNPLRARIVEDPKDYKWSGYGEAIAGADIARKGIQTIMMEQQRYSKGDYQAHKENLHWEGKKADKKNHEQKKRLQGNWKSTAHRYRSILMKDSRKDGHSPPIEKKQPQKEHQLLRHRVRYFVDGLAIGREDFLEKVFQHSKQDFGEKRSKGANKLKGIHTELRSMRKLIKQPYG